MTELKVKANWLRSKFDPGVLARNLNRIYHRRVKPRSWTKGEYNSGVEVFDEDWDNLIILDACRADIFRQVASERLPGETESRSSKASATPEFLRANFRNRDLTDTVYVTANGQFSRLQSELNAEFHKVVDLTQDDEKFVDLGEMGYVPPDEVRDSALKAYEEFPNKRLLVHFLQPHYPFLAEDAKYSHKRPDIHPSTQPNFFGEIFLSRLDLPKERIKEDYIKTLEAALPGVEELLLGMGGKSVVTADHGEALGEQSHPIPIKEWGHPRRTYIEPLVAVPWHVSQNGERRAVQSDPPIDEFSPDQGKVQERLRSLGYSMGDN
jgi:hypothetical protein